MLGTSRRFGQLLVKRASGSAAVSNAPTDPVTMAAFQFMADVAKSNTEERHRIDDKFDRALEKFSRSLESMKENLSSSQSSLKADVSSLKENLSSSQSSLKDSLKAEIHSLDKKVTIIVGISSFVVSLVTLAGVANRFGFLHASTAPIVAKSMEVVALTPWYVFW
ncbi:hypothetical protein Ndes2526B_g05019 [Nannochloris sp. 'desiccata']|nr:hypothetical protein NADE_008040 [Chlorella desiccata (nom. nud.)]